MRFIYNLQECEGFIEAIHTIFNFSYYKSIEGSSSGEGGKNYGFDIVIKILT